MRVLQFGSEVSARSEPTLLDLGIATSLLHGFAYRSRRNQWLCQSQTKNLSSLAVTAITVALMPPICVIGLGLSQADWSLSLGATLLYLTKLLGITLSCMLVFLTTGCISLHHGRKALRQTIIFTSLLLIRLGGSFIRLVQRAELEALIQQVLVNRTITFFASGIN
ncbi:DUF389 domain-containing protein [Gloeocapsopsis sp. IPPAS B-1203]|uniref:DUF389 domain-containing protein n=1 Tax=Gloeocapsopsis sp. IPPAS B-1203 TaxID=2049454 RepID=UPI0025A08A07|nr:DUF389 domain-containing protein [Gloeocapsopsis sp. IPPAS B-1203]